jgi:hypothetical protein
MEDLVQLAKRGDITKFEAAWASDNNKPYPFKNADDGALATAAYNRYRTMDSSASTTTTDPNKGANAFQKIAGGVLGVGGDIVGAQEQQGYLPNMTQEYIKMSGVIKGMLDNQGNLKGMADMAKTILGTMGDQGLL